MPAILFGSMSTLVDTSELQRAAFNAAFDVHDLGWTWDREQYAALLDSSGGRQRIADHAAARGQQVDAEAVHRTKSELFLRGLGSADLPLRPGVADTIRQARADGIALALVTTTSAQNVAALLAAVTPQVGGESFDVVVDASVVEHAKPDPAAYRFAVGRLNQDPSACVAVEDNLGGVESARAAGIACVAFPNVNTAEHDFAAATARLERLDLPALTALIGH